MAPKLFHRFSKLPIELRLRIWRMAIEPRVIRAIWRSEVLPEVEDVRVSVYVLKAGPVPSVLHVCKEAREETKPKYSFVKSRLQINGDHRLSKYLKKDIWVNFEIDTFYFINIPCSGDFLRYMRRLCKERISGGQKSIKQIAFSSKVLLHIKEKKKWDLTFLYRLISQHTELRNIIIMLDKSKFEDDLKPQDYSLFNPAILNDNARGKNDKVKECLKYFQEFFANPDGNGLAPSSDLTAFKAAKKANPDWVLPTVRLMSIAKGPKVGYASDGLPAVHVTKTKRVTSTPKELSATGVTATQSPTLKTGKANSASLRRAVRSSKVLCSKSGKRSSASAKTPASSTPAVTSH